MSQASLPALESKASRQGHQARGDSIIDVHPYLDWIAQHPHWAGGVVFLLALAESLVVVGLFVPGALAMFAAGALVAAGVLDLWPTLGWAAAGAIAGDGFSYWLGRHYREQLRTRWPFRRYPQWIGRSEEFFHRHGGMSVVLGRFVGPVRAVVPVIAGMLDMRPLRFFAVNILSALAWAPAYLLPGVVFGASLQLAGAVASRLALIITLLLIAIWGAMWATRGAILWVQPRMARGLAYLQAWAAAPAPRWGYGPRKFVASLLDPARPEFSSLAIFAGVLVFFAWGFFAVLEDVVTHDRLVLIDSTAYHLLQGLRTPPGDFVMVALTELGDGWVLLPIVVAVSLWLLWQRALRPAAYWVATVGVAAALTAAIKTALGRERPWPEAASGYAFPSGHATMSVVIYGLLALLIAHGRPLRGRIATWTAAVLLVTLIALSRLYLGAHWLSDVLGGVAFGTAWVALAGIAYLRHPAPVLSARDLTVVALSALLVSGSWRIATHHDRDLARYAVHREATTLAQPEWWARAWQTLPAWRVDLEGEHEQPLTVQWAGSTDSLRRALLAHGWQDPLPASGRNLLLWLDTNRHAMELPLLPRIHDGRHEVLALIHPADQPDQRLVLRLWPADAVLQGTGRPLSVGTVAQETMQRPLSWFNLPQESQDFNRPRAILLESFSDVDLRLAQRANEGRREEQQVLWDRQVLLAQTSEKP